MNKNFQLFDYDLNESFELFVLIKNAEVKVDKHGSPYIALTFQDRSGSIEGKLWSASKEDIDRYQPGKVVCLRGHRELYNGHPQVRITSIRLAKTNEPDDPSDYMVEGPMSSDEMKKAMSYYISEISNPILHAIIEKLMEEWGDDFYIYPAAKKNHHAFVGGLAFHTISMLRLGEAITDLYPNISKSLLYSGIICHDIGKVVEYTNPLTAEYGVEGNLIGHISIGGQKISMICQELGIDQGNEAVVLLKHMVLASHGKKEYGSPVEPHVYEAEIVHFVDDFDATMNMLNTALDDTEPGAYSSRIYGLDNRAFYKPKTKMD